MIVAARIDALETELRIIGREQAVGIDAANDANGEEDRRSARPGKGSAGRASKHVGE